MSCDSNGEDPLPDSTDSPLDENSPIKEKVDSGDLTLQDRLKHKNWRIRSEAYLELANQIETQESSTVLSSLLLDPLSKYIGDPNPMAQESALVLIETILNTEGKIKIVGPKIGDMVTALIDKCVGSSRLNIHEKGLDLLLELSDSELGPNVIDSIVENSGHPTSHRIVIASMKTLCAVIRRCGADDLNIDKMFAAVEKQAINSTNSNVRTESLQVYKEVYPYLKDEIYRYMTNLKPIQQEELKQEFSGNPRKTLKSRKESVEPKYYNTLNPNRDSTGIYFRTSRSCSTEGLHKQQNNSLINISTSMK